ncbi:ABC transporter permease [Sphingomonas sp. So64.6b]|uniref:ABC transporter permease n=1 Tax=Sphingomonas sp. So64.6b TaxID=2997354 RepID=UPI001600BD1A|nr:ABC transporter permease [Sphingomonas sp. So64.6b]QNA82597.1 ABC transporter permease [Sphingomonas sp. So64.6b]
MSVTLRRLIAWDLRLQARENVYVFTVLTTAAFGVFIALLPTGTPDAVITAILFLDPAIVGSSFVGSIVLMERGQNTLAALSVSPAAPGEYVVSKVITLTLLTILSGLALVLVAYWPVDPVRLLRFVVALTFTGTLGVVGGLILVARANSMNHLIARAFPVTILLFLPLFAHFGVVTGVWQWLLFAINPGHAMLRALLWAADPSAVTMPDVIYAFTYLAVLSAILFRWSLTVYGADLGRTED